MKDWMGRELNYLRLSLTERCNLRCIYCRDVNSHCSGKNELTYEELRVLMDAMVQLGVKKIRLTGGEPLVRKDLEQIVAQTASYPEVRDISMTTNAQGLADRIDALKAAGLKRINISVDSLKDSVNSEMTRGGDLREVLKGAERALHLGMSVKFNVVPIYGKNDSEIDDFVELARNYPIDVRFIELMPFPWPGRSPEKGMSSAAILAAHPEFHPVQSRDAAQPAEEYRGEGFAGRIGLISPISHKFCSRCNRLRITSEGRLRLCLGQNDETDIRPFIPEGSEAVREKIYEAAFHKPEQHAFETSGWSASRQMNQIGG